VPTMLQFCGSQFQAGTKRHAGRSSSQEPWIAIPDVVCTGDLHRFARVASVTTAWRSGWNGWSDAPARRSAGVHPLRRAPAVATTKAARTASHFGEIPSLRTSGSSNKRRTSRPSATRRARSRR
jgi:hypothetical protein